MSNAVAMTRGPEAMRSPIAAPPAEVIREVVRRALAEDVGHGDITTELTVPPTVEGTGTLLVKADGIICGLTVAEEVFRLLDANMLWTARAADGGGVTAGAVVAEAQGRASAILTGERVALNLLQRMSGIATMTGKYVGAVSGTRARILDTRKTAPGLRVLDKYAVRCGRGHNHRFGLFDGILIKDNHIEAAGGVRAAVEAARLGAPHVMKIEVEVDHIDQIQPALEAGADIILLDNMDPSTLSEAVEIIAGRAETEASGGISLSTVGAVAGAGVDYISVGGLTHSVDAVDISLELSL